MAWYERRKKFFLSNTWYVVVLIEILILPDNVIYILFQKSYYVSLSYEIMRHIIMREGRNCLN